MKCEICKKEFKQITNSHLKIHNITPGEYKKKYNIDRLREPNDTKGIWDGNLGKFKYIKHPDRKKVRCEICGKEYYRISTTHIQRKHQIDLEDYKDMFPDSPLFITTDEERELISKNHADISGKNNPMYGIALPPETIKRSVKKSKQTINAKHKTDKWLNVICDWCGVNFHKSPYHITDTNFCSTTCLGKWYSENRRGKNNANWNGGSSNEPYGFEFTPEYKEVIKYRDDFRCRMCGSKNKLCIHHIDYNKFNNNENNLITLCASCHGKTNGHREIFIRLFGIGEFDYLSGGWLEK